MFINRKKFVARKPYDDTIINDNGHFINGPRRYDERENYDFVYLDDIDKDECFVTEDDKFRDECVKKEKNIIKKILLVKPEIYNSSYHFNNVLES